MILRGSRYETATVARVAGRPVAGAATPLDQELYQRSLRQAPGRVPVPYEPNRSRTYAPTVFPVRVHPQDATATTIVSYRDYTIMMGDRLQDIAYFQYGDSNLWHLLATANPDLFDPDDLPPGRNLKVPTLSSVRRVAPPYTPNARVLPGPIFSAAPGQAPSAV